MHTSIMSRIGRRRAVPQAVTLLAVALLGGCGVSPPGDPTLSIELRWIESYEGERRAEVETGLLWTLSFLGAALPARGPDPLSWRGRLVTLRLDHAGIDARTLPRWRQLLASMKASGEYRTMGALDVGRFVAMTLCSSNHYYALTDAAPHYEQAYANGAFAPERVAIVESGVSQGNRLLEIPAASSLAQIAFLAHEGTGAVAQGTFVAEERELLDVMPNGQLRFALYGTDGALKPAANRTLTAAGKPAKCLWCHETHLLRPFDGRTSVPGYVSLGTFERRIAAWMDGLREARSALASRIDFEREQDHTYAELLYLAFYEPSAERVAREWGTDAARVQETLSQSPTHTPHELVLGQRLYRRSDVDSLAPYAVLEPPTDPREPSAYEPDLLR